jgi:hypothetical protein
MRRGREEYFAPRVERSVEAMLAEERIKRGEEPMKKV